MPGNENNTLSPEVYMSNLLGGYRITQMLYVVAKLSIADLLRDKPLTARELAEKTDSDPDALYRLLRTLVGLNIFTENEDATFGLTENSALLITGREDSLHPFAMTYGEDFWWQPWGNLLHAVKTGKPAFNKVYNKSLFEYLKHDRDAAETFNNNMAAMTQPDADNILKHYDFSDAKTVVDVGGSHGFLLTSVLDKKTDLTGILYDLPEVIESVKDEIKERGYAERCELVGGSFLESIPAGGVDFATGPRDGSKPF